VLGYADDAIVVAAVLRSVVRRVGAAPIAKPLARHERRLRGNVQTHWHRPPTEQSADS